MSELKNFRSAFRGFNRQDVVNYIEYINNTHNAQVEQLNNQLQAALARPTDEEMKAKLEAAEARIAELEETIVPITDGLMNLNSWGRSISTNKF